MQRVLDSYLILKYKKDRTGQDRTGEKRIWERMKRVESSTVDSTGNVRERKRKRARTRGIESS